LKAELDKYIVAVADVEISRADVGDFTENVLDFWRARRSELPAWSEVARMIFALSANSASCERVFSLLKSMFDHTQNSVLADILQGSLMMRYNKRDIG